MTIRTLALAGQVLAAAPLPASAILAQTEEGDTIALAPVVVTVLRSPVPLERLPFSASVMAGPELVEGAAGLFIEEALHALPGVRVQNRYNASVGERITIRGFGARSQFGVRGIKVLVDGIPATLPDGQTTLDHLDLGSLGRVEALRGPAAALYGNGAGGVLLFRSAAPYGGGYRQTATAVAGSDGLLRLQATGSGTAGTVALRTSVARSVFEGFRNNPSESGEDPYSRAERTTINAALSSEVRGGTLTVQLNGVDLGALNPGSLPADLFDEGSDQAWGFNVARGTRKDVRQGQAGVSWAGAVGGLDGVFSAYGTRRLLDNPLPTRVIDLKRNGGGARAALGTGWGGGRADFGVEAEFQSDDRRNYLNEDGQAGDLVLDQRESVRAMAVFGQLRLSVGTRLEAMGALRADRFDFRAADSLVNAGDPDDSGERAMGSFSPSFGIHVDLGDHGVFASVAHSFETPTTTELANQPDRAGGFNPALEPQRGWTVEGGIRGALGGRSAYDIAVFHTALTNQLVPFEVRDAPGRRFYRNAVESRVRGLEFSTRTRLSPLLTVRLAYGYVDARFTEFAVGSDTFDGNRVPGLAPHRLEGALRVGGGVWFGEARVETRGEVPANDANDAAAEGFTLLELRLGATGLRAGNLRLSPFVALTNPTDARHASSVVVNAFGGRYFEPGPGRGGHVGLSLVWESAPEAR